MSTAAKETVEAGRDWFGYFLRSWPLFLCIGSVLLVAGERTPSKETRRDEITRALGPVAERVRQLGLSASLQSEHFRIHEKIDGHAAMEERVRALELRIQRLEAR